jgi:hypothetical protein
MDSVSATFSGGIYKERREMCVVVKADVQEIIADTMQVVWSYYTSKT